MHRTGLFGAYRLILALLVLALHIGGIKAVGAYAVFGFYALSGYLMTLITQERYGFSRKGILSYLSNRALRLYPLYLTSILLSLVLLSFLPIEITKSYHPTMFTPSLLSEWATNIFILFGKGFLLSSDQLRLTPPAWALTVEIFFYIAIGLGASRTRKRTLIWFTASVLYHIAILSMSLSWWWQYFSITGASLPFSTGALLYHYRNSILKFSKSLAAWPSILGVTGLFILNWWGATQTDWRGFSFYANYIIMTLALVVCMARNADTRSIRIDRTLGELSYPLYLIHYQAGLAAIGIAAAVDINLSRPDLHLLAVTAPLALLVSWLLVVLIERPIERLRKYLKPQQPQPLTECKKLAATDST